MCYFGERQLQIPLHSVRVYAYVTTIKSPQLLFKKKKKKTLKLFLAQMVSDFKESEVKLLRGGLHLMLGPGGREACSCPPRWAPRAR